MSWYYSKFFKRVRRYIFQQTEAALYEPVVKQTLEQKVIRIYQDNSFVYHNRQFTEEEYKESVERDNRMLLWIYKILFSHKKCAHPYQGWILAWYFWVAMAIMYFFVEVGIILTFGQSLWIQEKQSSLVYGVHIFFLLILYGDVIVQFRTGYLHRGMVIMERERVIARYLRGRFFLDMLILIILTISIQISSFGINYVKILIILNFRRIYEIDKFYLRALSLHRKSKTAYVLFKQMVIIYVLSHIQGVIFYWIDFSLLSSEMCQNNSSLCWLNSTGAYSPIIELPWNLQYFYIIYWGFSTITTVSYGDIGSANPIELIYEVSMFCLDFAIYAYIINSIIKILLWARSKKDKVKSQMIMIDTYMKQLQIDNQLQEEVRMYLRFLQRQEKDRDEELEEQMKSKLPVELRLQLVKSAYSLVFQSLQYMLELGPSVATLLFSLKEQIYTSNEQIISQSTIVDKLSFIFKGQVKLECLHRQVNHEIAVVSSLNEYIAQKQFFLREKIPYTVTARKSSRLYHINREVFEQQCSKHISFRESMRFLQYSVRITTKASLRILHSCCFCREGHSWNQCPKKFPNFKQTRLTGSESSKKEGLQARMRPLKHRTWLDRKKLYELDVLTKISQDKFYGRIQKRLMKIKDQIVLNKHLFEVDTAHDWSTYIPDQNLSRLKETLNNSQVKKMLNRRSAFMGSIRL